MVKEESKVIVNGIVIYMRVLVDSNFIKDQIKVIIVIIFYHILVICEGHVDLVEIEEEN